MSHEETESTTCFSPSLSVFPQVKVCGLTRVDEAVACAGLGAHAIGCVFYTKSPRNVTDEQARDICRALPSNVYGVGVFVNDGFSHIMQKVERCGLKAVQLHGKEPASLVKRLKLEDIIVIKVLFSNASPTFAEAESYEASSYLVECAGGPLPGGNALSWDWSTVADFAQKYPTVVAGGLTPGNVAGAIRSALPDAVDVSSGVEAAPGRKDIEKVKRFLAAVSQSGSSRNLRKIFP